MLPRRSPRLLEKAARLALTVPPPVIPPLRVTIYNDPHDNSTISYENFGMDYEGYVIGNDNIAYHTLAIYEFENDRIIQRHVLYFTYKELFQFGHFIRGLKRDDFSCLPIGRYGIQGLSYHLCNYHRCKDGKYEVEFLVSDTIKMRVPFTKNDEVHQELVQRFHEIHQDMGRQQEDLEDGII